MHGTDGQTEARVQQCECSLLTRAASHEYHVLALVLYKVLRLVCDVSNTSNDRRCSVWSAYNVIHSICPSCTVSEILAVVCASEAK